MRRVAAWFCFSVYLLGLLSMVFFSGALLKDLEGIAFTAAFGAFPAVGLIIVLKRPENPLGWVFCTIGLLAGMGLFSWSYSDYSYYVLDEPLPLALWIAWAGSWFWYPLLASIVVLPLLLFPDGLLSRRWRPVLSLALTLIVGVTLLAATTKTFVAGEDQVKRQQVELENPVGLWDTGGRIVDDLPIFQAFWYVLLVLMLLGVLSLVLRFRRSRGRERLQMKWFTYSAAMMVVNLAIGSFIPSFDTSLVSGVIFVLTIAAFPVTCGIAIVKHQLYEIDVIVNRTLVYGLLTAVLVGLYLGAVFLFQQIASGITADSDLAVAASTLLVAAVFRPLRVRVQAFIDRRFYRRKYDAQHTLESFSSRLRDEVDLDHLARDLSGVVRDTMQPAHVSVWLRTVRS